MKELIAGLKDRRLGVKGTEEDMRVRLLQAMLQEAGTEDGAGDGAEAEAEAEGSTAP
eukprot:SAG22_NODE_5298_length_1042_cov_1.057264_3_plen_57_part_01